MKNSTIAQSKYKLISIVLIILTWQALTYNYSPLVVPSIEDVLKAIIHILTDRGLLSQIVVTTNRLVIALTISIVIGSFIGILIGWFRKLRIIFSPMIGIMQSVPPISWIVLAIIWFGLDGKASVFMVVVSTLPMMMINLIEGIANIDQKLIEMGQLFKFSKVKILRSIIIPSIMPYFKSALQIVIGHGWKVIVMGEVLTTSNGIGGELTNARLNIETEYIFAWTSIIVALFFITNKLVSYIFNKRVKGEGYGFKDRKFE